MIQCYCYALERFISTFTTRLFIINNTLALTKPSECRPLSLAHGSHLFRCVSHYNCTCPSRLGTGVLAAVVCLSQPLLSEDVLISSSELRLASKPQGEETQTRPIADTGSGGGRSTTRHTNSLWYNPEWVECVTDKAVSKQSLGISVTARSAECVQTKPVCVCS